MTKNLVIVESPAKAKTIEKYLGSGFTVLSSVGHIRSIAKKSKEGKDAIDVKNGFKTTYEIDPEKKKIVAELKKAVKNSDAVWLATDEDREGESIAWHLCEVLDLDISKTKRIVFHEITKSAIDEAIKNPRTVDMALVEAQQARQILDRIVGFELSPVVWQKVPGGKSAGRVQSPAVRLLVEREREVEKFDSDSSFKVTATFKHQGEEINAELPKKFSSEDEAHEFLKKLIGAEFKVSDISKSPSVRKPSAPFTTSTLQQEANSRLGFSAKSTMSSAQKLYQDGKITYMRTDSITLSKQAIASAASYIESRFGKEYVDVKNFKTKVASAQEAHEAIRPTDMSLEKASSNEYDQKLYTLIRNRTLASQMSPARLEKTLVTIEISTANEKFEAKGEIIIFDGFLKAYGSGKNDEKILPNMNSGDSLKILSALAKQVFSRPPARYSEGALVKKLEELGIGRPSTYATIISTIQTRGYVEKGMGEGKERESIEISLKNDTVERNIVTEKTGADKGKLVPTAAGEVLSDFLYDHFNKVVDYGFTAQIEKEFDAIAVKKLERNKMLEHFYAPFHELVEQSGGIDRKAVTKIREVGVDPKTGLTVFARFGRFGPMLQLGDGEGDNKPQFAPMPAGSKIDNVTIEKALIAFELPRIVGKTAEGVEIKANIGRFGPYIQYDKTFVSIKPLDPHTITESEALELIKEKIKKDAAKNIAEFPGGIKVLNGRYGPYITDGTKNAKIPKDTDPKTIDEKQAIELLKAAPTKSRFAAKKAKKTVRKPRTPKKSKN
jgi:DNA topoisomerase-1